MFGSWPPPSPPPKEPPKAEVDERRMKVILVLNRWKRERNNAPEVIDLLIEEMAFKARYEGVE